MATNGKSTSSNGASGGINSQVVLDQAELHRAGREVRFFYTGPVDEVVRAIPPACEAFGEHWQARVRMFDQWRGRETSGIPDGQPDR